MEEEHGEGSQGVPWVKERYIWFHGTILIPILIYFVVFCNIIAGWKLAGTCRTSLFLQVCIAVATDKLFWRRSHLYSLSESYHSSTPKFPWPWQDAHGHRPVGSYRNSHIGPSESSKEWIRSTVINVDPRLPLRPSGKMGHARPLMGTSEREVHHTSVRCPWPSSAMSVLTTSGP